MVLSNSLAYLIVVPAFASIIIMAVREHRRVRACRRGLLQDCARVLEAGAIAHGGDDFPSLSGSWRARPVEVRLIPDTMTIRRLPQLWLSVTWLAPIPRRAAFSALVRHTGYEFYDLSSHFEHRLDPPHGLPDEIIVRGKDAGSQQLLNLMQAPLVAIFSDPLVKEVDVTPKGLRIIRQAGEGRRGEHLLLRQAIFDDARVPASNLKRTLLQLEELHAMTSDNKGARAA
jgi:hypothetical protein